MDIFDKNKKHNSLILNDNNNTVHKIYTNADYAFRVYCKNIMINGIHKCSFLIKEKSNSWTGIGIAKANDTSFRYLGYEESFGLINDGKIYNKSKCIKNIGTSFNNGDIIELTLDLDNYKLTFKLNEYKSILDIPVSHYVFGVSLYYANSCVQILNQ